MDWVHIRAMIRLHTTKPHGWLLHHFLVLALILPLIQVAQIATPNAAPAVSVSSAVTANFKYASPGTFVVPEGVTSIPINIRGCLGGKSSDDLRVACHPGDVNIVTGKLNVTPRETLNFEIGGGGTDRNGCVKNSSTRPSGYGNFGGALENNSGGSDNFIWGNPGRSAGSGTSPSVSAVGTIFVVSPNQCDTQDAHKVSSHAIFTI